jgi:hypothetical protein
VAGMDDMLRQVIVSDPVIVRVAGSSLALIR